MCLSNPEPGRNAAKHDGGNYQDRNEEKRKKRQFLVLAKARQETDHYQRTTEILVGEGEDLIFEGAVIK